MTSIRTSETLKDDPLKAEAKNARVSTWHRTNINNKIWTGSLDYSSPHRMSFSGTFPAIDELLSVCLWKTCSDLWLIGLSRNWQSRGNVSGIFISCVRLGKAHKEALSKMKIKGDWTNNHISSLRIRFIIAAGGSSVARRWSHNVTKPQSRKMKTSFQENLMCFYLSLRKSSRFPSGLVMIQSYFIKVIFLLGSWKHVCVFLLFAEQYKLLMDHIEKTALEWSGGTLQFTTSPAGGVQARRPAGWSVTEPVLCLDNPNVTLRSKRWLLRLLLSSPHSEDFQYQTRCMSTLRASFTADLLRQRVALTFSW